MKNPQMLCLILLGLLIEGEAFAGKQKEETCPYVLAKGESSN